MPLFVVCRGLCLLGLFGLASSSAWAQAADSLLAAAQRGDAVAVQAALATGASVDASDAEGATPLFWAAHAGDANSVQALLGAGATVDGVRGVIWTDSTRTGYYGSPLAVAAGLNRTEALQALLDAGADPDAREWNPASGAFDGWTALQWAANEGHLSAAARLLAAGAAVDLALPDDGMTPLLLAARNTQTVSVRQLACAGADLAHVDASGRGLADHLDVEVSLDPACTPDDAIRFGTMIDASRRAGETWQAGEREASYAALTEYQALAEDLLGADHGWTLTATRNLGHVAYFTERKAEALDLYHIYLGARDSVLSDEEADQIHNRVLNLLVDLGRIAEVGPHAERLIEIRRRTGPPVELATALLARAGIAYAAGDLDPAGRDFEEIARVLEGVEGQEAIREDAISMLTGIYFGQQRWDEAAALNTDLVAVIEAREGADAEALIRPLRMTGDLAFARGDWKSTVRAHTRVVELVEQHRGSDSPELIEALQSLGRAHVNLRAFGEARPRLDRARALCAQHALQASEACRRTEASLAALSESLGDDQGALILRREAVERLLADSSAVPSDLGEAHYRLAEAHRQLGGVEEAEMQYRASLEAFARAAPADKLSAWLIGLSRVQTRDALVELLEEQGRGSEAQAVRDAVPDTENPYESREEFVTLRRVQTIRSERGEELTIEEELDLELQNLRAFEGLFGADNLDLADNWTMISLLQRVTGDLDASRASALRGAELVTRGARDGLAAMSLAEQRLFLDGVIPEQVASLVLAFQDADWAEPYRHMFRWKGLLLQTLRQEAALGRLAASDPDLAAVRDRLLVTRRAFATATATPGEEARAAADRLAREKEALERDLLARLDRQDPLESLGLDGFRALMPPDAALVDIYRVESALGDPVYAVVTVTRDMLGVATVGAPEIDQIVALWHDAASSGRPIGSEFEALGRIDRFIQERLPDGIERIWVSPDAALVRFPWALFLGLEGRVVTQVASPRALAVLLSEPAPTPTGELLLVGDVDFGDASSPWAPLPGTAVEIDRLHELATTTDREVMVLRAEAATPRAVADALPGARVAHLATHGFFSSAPSVLAGSRSRQGPDVEFTPEQTAAASRNPLAESGLALAGANAGPEGALTAEELVGLDLSGTQLVTLSACETGRGAEVSGQGVLGLQASLTTAGARSVLMSLWSVPDASTAALMEAFYRALWVEGLSPARALMQAQAVVFQTPGWEDPVHWAAWVLVGDG